MVVCLNESDEGTNEERNESDEGKKHTYGSNAYPPLYDYVYDTIRSIVDEME